MVFGKISSGFSVCCSFLGRVTTASYTLFVSLFIRFYRYILAVLVSWLI